MPIKIYIPAGAITDLAVQIYCDIFRPVTDEKLPAILAVSPYGKNGHGKLLSVVNAHAVIET